MIGGQVNKSKLIFMENNKDEIMINNKISIAANKLGYQT